MRIRGFCLLLPLVLVGCENQRGPERVPTVPVHGQVLVDGQPAENVRVTFHALSQPLGTASVYTSVPKDITDKKGRFALSTYVQGDGVVEGSYLITFEKLRFDAFRNRYVGPDQFKGRYANPDETEFRVTVTGGVEVVELDPFELTMKEDGTEEEPP